MIRVLRDSSISSVTLWQLIRMCHLPSAHHCNCFPFERISNPYNLRAFLLRVSLHLCSPPIVCPCAIDIFSQVLPSLYHRKCSYDWLRHPTKEPKRRGTNYLVILSPCISAAVLTTDWAVPRDVPGKGLVSSYMRSSLASLSKIVAHEIAVTSMNLAEHQQHTVVRCWMYFHTCCEFGVTRK